MTDTRGGILVCYKTGSTPMLYGDTENLLSAFTSVLAWIAFVLRCQNN